MEVVYERCCGLDVHKQTVVACVIVPGPGKLPHKEIRTFGTMTADLLETLEGANIKLGSVATDVLGVSGRAMLDALVAGNFGLVCSSAEVLDAWPASAALIVAP